MKQVNPISVHYRLLFCVAAIFLRAGNILALSATDTIQAESFSGQSGGVTIETCLEGGQDVTSILNGSYIYFNSVDFGSSGIQCFEARIASYGSGGYIEVHLDSLNGTLVCNCETKPVTGGWQTWTSRTCRLSGVSGVHTVYLKFTGGTGNLFSLNWFKFHGTQTFITTGWRTSNKTAKGKWNGTINLTSASGTPNITVFPDTMYQRVEGHGGAFNDNGAHCIDTINRISSGMGAVVMRELFDPVNGCKFNMGRVPIGMSDFSVDSSSLDTTTNDYSMTYFSIAHDLKYNIPYVKAAMQYQPNLMIYGSPWTPPSWMKNPKTWQGILNNTTVSVLNQTTQNLTAYALYFQKFIQSWEQQGISIIAVYPQNESEYQAGDHPSCSWGSTYGTALKTFCRDYLCPDLNQNNIATEVWMGTFFENGFSTDVGPTLSDTLARKLIKGCGLQRGGSAQMNQCIDTSIKYNLHWHAMQTENWCYSGNNTWNDAMSTYAALFDFWTNNTNSFNFWNMILDSNYYYVSWMGRAQNAMVIINPRAKPLPTVKYTGEFYTMKHFSYYIAIGATRIKTTTSGSGLTSTAFKNPDGSIIVEVMNGNNSASSAVIKIGSQAFTASLPDSSANTFILGGNPDTHDWTPGVTGVQYVPPKRTVAAISGPAGVYDISGRLIKPLDLLSSGMTAGGVVWDRTDASGRKAAPGLYIIMSRSGKDIKVQKVMCQ